MSKKRIKKTLELHLNSEISIDKKGKEFIEISGQYQEMLNRITNEICKEFEKLITKEIVIAHLEGQPTSRLTSLINKLK